MMQSYSETESVGGYIRLAEMKNNMNFVCITAAEKKNWPNINSYYFFFFFAFFFIFFHPLLQ